MSGEDKHRETPQEELQRAREAQECQLGHLPQQSEAIADNFVSGRPRSIDGHRVGEVPLDEGAAQGPGGDSRPDLIDPNTAKFRNAERDPEFTTTRTDEMPEVERDLAAEMASKRSDDDLEIVAKPAGPNFSSEVTDLHRVPHKTPKEPQDR